MLDCYHCGLFVVAGFDLYFDILMLLGYCLNLFANSADLLGCFGRLGLHCRHCFVVDSVLGSCLGSTDFVVDTKRVEFGLCLDSSNIDLDNTSLVVGIVVHCIVEATYYCRVSDLVATAYNVA